MGTGTKLIDALKNIVWYNGHDEWLKELRDEMAAAVEKGEAIYSRDFEWDTENHTIWMLLVGAFGDWGTSIRSGWIDRLPQCIAFIDVICEQEE